LDRLKTSREDTRRENRILTNENAALEQELVVMRKANQGLRQKIAHLEKMIYGKTIGGELMKTSGRKGTVKKLHRKSKTTTKLI
jgi:hypothetical protein